MMKARAASRAFSDFPSGLRRSLKAVLHRALEVSVSTHDTHTRHACKRVEVQAARMATEEAEGFEPSGDDGHLHRNRSSVPSATRPRLLAGHTTSHPLDSAGNADFARAGAYSGTPPLRHATEIIGISTLKGVLSHYQGGGVSQWT
jgi:hypothetical protein